MGKLSIWAAKTKAAVVASNGTAKGFSRNSRLARQALKATAPPERAAAAPLMGPETKPSGMCISC